MPIRTHYLHHRIDCEPLAWNAVAKALAAKAPAIEAANGLLYGVWRSQIGQPRDTLNAITAWHESRQRLGRFHGPVQGDRRRSRARRHGDDTDAASGERHAAATPGQFRVSMVRDADAELAGISRSLRGQRGRASNPSYDSQVIGLWKVEDIPQPDVVRSLLMTRRPDLAMWERSKIPQGEKETAVREALSRRYDLCSSTYVYTTTLLTAEDREDTARWT